MHHLCFSGGCDMGELILRKVCRLQRALPGLLQHQLFFSATGPLTICANTRALLRARPIAWGFPSSRLLGSLIQCRFRRYESCAASRSVSRGLRCALSFSGPQYAAQGKVRGPKRAYCRSNRVRCSAFSPIIFHHQCAQRSDGNGCWQRRLWAINSSAAPPERASSAIARKMIARWSPARMSSLR